MIRVEMRCDGLLAELGAHAGAERRSALAFAGTSGSGELPALSHFSTLARLALARLASSAIAGEGSAAVSFVDCDLRHLRPFLSAVGAVLRVSGPPIGPG